MITNSKIAWGDQLGAQLTTLTALIYVAEENKQNVVFWEEMYNLRRGYQFLKVFNIANVEVISRSGRLAKKLIEMYCAANSINSGSWQKQMNRIYNNRIMEFADRVIALLISWRYRDFRKVKDCRNDLHTIPKLMKLSEEQSYDIAGGFGTYQDWKKYEDKIRKSFSFKPEILTKANAVYAEVSGGKETVAVHFCRTDYLVLSSLNLGMDYYQNAMSLFNDENVRYLVFSDDIEGCKNLELFHGKDAVFMPANSAGVDMCLMSLCDNNIITNSTFSFWGAFLGENKKKVVCSRKYVGGEEMYLNGNYYPDTWIAL